MKNFSAKLFRERERHPHEEYPAPCADLEEWRLQWHEDVQAAEQAKVAAGKA